MKYSVITAALFAACIQAAALSFADTGMPHSHAPSPLAQAQSPSSPVHKARGTVNKINPDGTLNITHGPVDSLKWPGMTMNFQVKDKALLKNLKAGQKIDFEIGMGASGYVIIAISAAK